MCVCVWHILCSHYCAYKVYQSIIIVHLLGTAFVSITIAVMKRRYPEQIGEERIRLTHASVALFISGRILDAGAEAEVMEECYLLANCSSLLNLIFLKNLGPPTWGGTTVDRPSLSITNLNCSISLPSAHSSVSIISRSPHLRFPSLKCHKLVLRWHKTSQHRTMCLLLFLFFKYLPFYFFLKYLLFYILDWSKIPYPVQAGIKCVLFMPLLFEC